MITKMMVRAAVLSGMLVSAAAFAGAQDITVLTTTWTPYSYEEGGYITGLGTDVVRDVLGKAGIIADIRLYPWKRAIVTAMEQKNVMIYPLIRIHDRERDFIWVAPLFDARICLFKLKNRTDININSLDDARKYNIGVLRGAAMHHYLKSHGFEDKKQLFVLNSNRKSVELLFRKRIDLVADNPLVIRNEAKKLGFSMNEAENIFLLFEDQAYMALSKGSSDDHVWRLRNAFMQLKNDGTIDAIIEKYN